MDHVLWGMSEKSGCGVSFGTIRIIYLDFADVAVIFADTTEVLAGALDLMSEEAEPLGLRVFWIETKVQAFGDTWMGPLSHVSGENVVVPQTVTYSGSVIPSSTSCDLKLSRGLGRAWSATHSLDESMWRCRYLCRWTKVRFLPSLVLPVLLYFCETWNLTGELRRRLNSLAAMALRRIFGFHWHDYMPNYVVRTRLARSPAKLVNANYSSMGM